MNHEHYLPRKQSWGLCDLYVIINLMNDNDAYVIAGSDILPFVTDWAAVLIAGGGESRGLLDHALDDSDYSYGGYFMMGNIGSRATSPTATDAELLLFAVLSVFQMSDFPGVDPKRWEGVEAHLDYAFKYFREIGEKEAARRLREDVVRRSLREDPPIWREMKQSRSRNPAREASHDQDMATIDQRSLRAAQLLDPEGDFDSELRAFFQL
ncbi:hypothetical protein [Arthrobacter rhizosphaerae]|uniref:hypothetical protein n=1 Tax=Arthrobacter rhizosphaerae TaxID=2855490 RepID=UPI001FF52277|nr:hypothetical protein [Arthrobacter rhizosphaerae]